MRTQLHLLLALLCLLLVPAPAVAGWGNEYIPFRADRDEDELEEMVEELLPRGRELQAQWGTDAVLLLNEEVLEVEGATTRTTFNGVWWLPHGGTEAAGDFEYRLPSDETPVRFLARTGIPGGDAGKFEDVRWSEPEASRLVHEPDGRVDRGDNFRFPAEGLPAGSVVVISIERTELGTPLLTNFWFRRPYPIVEARLAMRVHDRRRYRVFGLNFGEPGITRYNQKFDGGSQFRVVGRDIAPEFDEPWRPPYYTWRPIFFLFRDRGQRHWNEVGLALEKQQRELVRSYELLPDYLGSIAAHGLEGFALMDALADSLNREYPLRWAWPGDDRRDEYSLDHILRVRYAAAGERTTLFAVSAEMIGLTAVIRWTHDRRRGAFNRKLIGRGFIDEPVVAVSDGDSTRYYDLSCAICPPGTLDPRRAGADYIHFPPGLSRVDELLEAEGLKEFGLVQNDGMLFLKLPMSVANFKWAEFGRWPLHLPGQSTSAMTRIVRHDPGGERARYWRESVGSRNDYRDWFASGGHQEFVEGRVRANFGESASAGVPRAFEIGDTLRIEAEIHMPALPAPEGDEWVLPTELLMGESSWLERWDGGPRHHPLYIPRDQHYVFESTVPLPEGWEVADPRVEKQWEAPPVRSTFRREVVDGVLVLRRDLWYRGGQWEAGEAYDAVYAWHASMDSLYRSPTVLRREPMATGGR